MRNTMPRIPCADLKSALGRTLKLAETGIGGPPIPEVKECINGILKIIAQEAVSE